MRYLDESFYRQFAFKFSDGKWAFTSHKLSVRSRDEITNGEEAVAFGTFRDVDAQLMASSKDLYLALLDLHFFCIKRGYNNCQKAERALQKAVGKLK